MERNVKPPTSKKLFGIHHNSYSLSSLESTLFIILSLPFNLKHQIDPQQKATVIPTQTSLFTSLNELHAYQPISIALAIERVGRLKSTMKAPYLTALITELSMAEFNHLYSTISFS